MTSTTWEAAVVNDLLGLKAQSFGDDATVLKLSENSGEYAALLATHLISKDDRKLAQVKHVPTGMKIPAFIYTRNENNKLFKKPDWYDQGNAQLMAKINKLIRLEQQKNTAKGFSHLNDYSFLGNCLEAGTKADLISKDQPVGTLKNIIDKAEIKIGYVETDAFPLLSVTKKVKSSKKHTLVDDVIYDDNGDIISSTNEEGSVKGIIIEIEKDIIEQYYYL